MDVQETMLVVLTIVALIVLIVVGFYLVKLLIDLSKLAQSATRASDTLQTEMEPTLKELRQAVDSINSIAATANSKYSSLNNAIKNVGDATSKVGKKIGGVVSGVLSGILVGLKVFKK